MNTLRITKDGFQGNLEGTASYAKVSGKVGDYSADVIAQHINIVSRIKLDGDGSQYLPNDGTYKTVPIPEIDIPTKLSDFENDTEYVSRSEVERLIAEAIANLGGGDTPVEPDIPEEPDTPEEPEIPEEIGSIDSATNDIIVDETQLSADTYTLRYVDENDNIVDNFSSIVTFEIN